MKKWHIFLIWWAYLIVLDVPFQMIRYLLDNNLLKEWYFFGVGLLFLSLGWLGTRLPTAPTKTNKHK